MRITFFFEHGKKKEIGTGHMYRSMGISERLKSLGHKVSFMKDEILMSNTDVLVIDHIHSQKSLIERAKHAGIKVVLIDGADEDVELVDASISAFVNQKSQYIGIKYIAFPASSNNERYSVRRNTNAVFIAMGGFDCNNLAEKALGVLDKLNINAIVAKSINHSDLSSKFNRVVMFEEDNYYNAMHECKIGITNGGLTLFQALHYGLPCIAIPQYEHQKVNIESVQYYCEAVDSDMDGLEDKIEELMNNEYKRESVSLSSQYHVDGKGIARICSIIEGLG